jgi:hypothetical protein
MPHLLTLSVTSRVEVDDLFALCTVPLRCLLARPRDDHNLLCSDVPDSLIPVSPVQMKGQIPTMQGLSLYRQPSLADAWPCLH